jgi:hypothetical protein
MTLDPLLLNLKGGTQPEIFEGTVDDMAGELRLDAMKFWLAALAKDGPIEIWEINGERWLANGNHRYQAAIRAGVAIPADMIGIVDMSGCTAPTWRFDQMTWLPGRK